MSTANDVAAAFRRWREAYVKSAGTFADPDPYIRFFADESGSVWVRDQHVPDLSFHNFTSAVAQLNEAYERLIPKPAVGDAILYVAATLKITNVYANQPSIRAADEKNQVVVYAPFARLVAAGVRAWQLAA